MIRRSRRPLRCSFLALDFISERSGYCGRLRCIGCYSRIPYLFVDCSPLLAVELALLHIVRCILSSSVNTHDQLLDGHLYGNEKAVLIVCGCCRAVECTVFTHAGPSPMITRSGAVHPPLKRSASSARLVWRRFPLAFYPEYLPSS